MRALNECARRLFGAATQHNHKNCDDKRKKCAKIRNKVQCKKAKLLTKIIFFSFGGHLGYHIFSNIHVCKTHGSQKLTSLGYIGNILQLI